MLTVVNPFMMAGLLYVGSGVGLGLLRSFGKTGRHEAPLGGRDWLWLAGASFFGGIVAPALFMLGLDRSTAATSSLLLNVEAVATALIAWIVFREHASGRTLSGMAAIIAGAAILAWSGQPLLHDAGGPIGIVGACVAWAIDNNLTRNIAGSDAVQIAALKSFTAGTVNVVLALLIFHATVPAAPFTMAAAAIGFLGYGLSLVCYILALRFLGTARTGAYFSTAPFIGAIVSIAIGSASVDWRFTLAALLMAVGVWLHVTERHEHVHVHEELTHEHAHTHDEHHQHEHQPWDPPGEPHVHRHRHAALAHDHEHFPDLHHRHGH